MDEETPDKETAVGGDPDTREPAAGGGSRLLKIPWIPVGERIQDRRRIQVVDSSTLNPFSRLNTLLRLAGKNFPEILTAPQGGHGRGSRWNIALSGFYAADPSFLRVWPHQRGTS